MEEGQGPGRSPPGRGWLGATELLERGAARLILDTTVLVDAERGGGSLGEVIDDGDDVAVAAITVAELKVGVQMAKGRRREKRARFVAADVSIAS